MNIGKVIAERRKKLALSQGELASRLTLMGVEITNQAVCKWENGATQPNAGQLLALCVALDIDDVLAEFSGGRLGVYAGINGEGRAMMDEYKKLLLSSGRYGLKKNVPAQLRSLPLYSLAVSAGTGQFLDGENYEMTEVGEDVPEGANFGVRVSGDSMEPEYHDSQVVWVKQQRTLMTGETGIFLYDGCAYLKRLAAGKGTLALHSLNPSYADITVSPELPLRVLGKVLS